MLKRYIAAGFDPARFWDITARLYVLEMAGATERIRKDREMVWWSAMMPYVRQPPELEQFVRPALRRRRMAPVEMQAMCDALAASWGAKKPQS